MGFGDLILRANFTEFSGNFLTFSCFLLMNVGPQPFPNNRKRRAANFHLIDTVVTAHRASRSAPGSSNMQPMIVNVPTRRVGKRPIDKALISVLKGILNSAQQTTTLATVSNACTICGLRWSLSIYQDGGTGHANGKWAIVVVRDGNSANTISSTDGSSFYQPEQDCLAFGAWVIDNNSQTKDFEGNTKTMRKMLIGDQLIFVAMGGDTDTSAIRGVVQFFCKT